MGSTGKKKTRTVQEDLAGRDRGDSRERSLEGGLGEPGILTNLLTEVGNS